MPASASEAPLVSVIIPLYNCERFVGECIQSVLRQTYGNYEIIVINDGSTDGSSLAVQPYLDKIVYIEQENSGSSAARNSGIKKAKGELIAFLDADDVWLPDRLALQTAVFTSDPETGLVHSNVVHFNSETGDEFVVDDSRRRSAGSGNILRSLFEYNFICTQSVMMRKKCFDDVGYFDPEFRAAQDYDLWLRVCGKYKARYIPEVVTRYRIHAGQISRKFSLTYESERRVIEKFVNDHPGLTWLTGELISKRLWNLYFRFGHDCFYNRQLGTAMNAFKESLRYKPMNLPSLFYWILSSYGSGAVSTLDKIRGKNGPL